MNDLKNDILELFDYKISPEFVDTAIKQFLEAGYKPAVIFSEFKYFKSKGMLP